MALLRKLFSYLKTKPPAALYITYVPLADTTGSPLLSQAFSSQNLSDFFNAAFKIALIVGAILAVLRLAYAGFLYMTTDLWSQKGHAKEVIQNVFLGLLLLLAVYMILYQINPNLLNVDFLRSVRSNPAPGGTSQTTNASNAGAVQKYCAGSFFSTQYANLAECQASWSLGSCRPCN